MQLPSEVPVMTLSNVILFPQAMLPLYIFEPRYRKMLADSLETSRMFAVAMQKPGVSRERPSSVAGLGLIRAAVRNRDGTSHLVLQGVARIELTRSVRYRPYRVHAIRPLPTAPATSMAALALTSKLVELVHQRLKLGLRLPFKTLTSLTPPGTELPEVQVGDAVATKAFKEVVDQLSSREDPEPLADLVSATLLPAPQERQVILETRELESRLRYLVRFMMNEIRRLQEEKAHE